MSSLEWDHRRTAKFHHHRPDAVDAQENPLTGDEAASWTSPITMDENIQIGVTSQQSSAQTRVIPSFAEFQHHLPGA